jgi:hypothetical protein
VSSTAPGSPSNGSIWFDTDDSKSYIYYNGTWAALGGGGGGLTVGQTAPASPAEGDMWYDSDTGQTFVYYDSYWVEVGPTTLNNVSSTVTTKGDLLVASGSASLARLGVGSNNQVLIADSAATNGLKWGSTVSGLTLSSATITGPSVVGGSITSSAITTPTIDRGSFVSPLEKWNIVASAPSTTTTIDLLTASIWYYTTDSTANFTLNFRGSSASTLSSLLAVGESITTGFLMKNGTTAYRPTVFQVDGANVTPIWQGGTAPTAGNTSSHDSYVFTIVKTAATPTYIVIASQTRFA